LAIDLDLLCLTSKNTSNKKVSIPKQQGKSHGKVNGKQLGNSEDTSLVYPANNPVLVNVDVSKKIKIGSLF